MSWPRIAIFRALQLGDMLCMVPALRALRAHCPQSHITLVGLPWAVEFTRRFCRYVDEFVPFPGMEGFPEQAADEAAMAGFIRRMRQSRFDLALQMHGSGTLSNALVSRFGAAEMAGFYPSGQPAPEDGVFIRWDEQRNEVLRFLDLLARLGVPARGVQLEFPLLEEDFAGLRAAAPGLAGRGDYICVHPGARYASRRWPASRFAAVANRAAEQGLQVVLTGSANEAALTAQVREQLRGPVLDLTGRTSLGSLAALVAGARLVVCNDTGLSHVATAVATPSVVISSGSDTRRWSPLDAARHRVLSGDAPCRPCMHLECPHEGHPCASGVTVEQVWEAANAALNGHAGQSKEGG